jgi:gas vesicle protein GvpL/GvpF
MSVRGVMGEPLQAVRIGGIDAIVGRVRAVPKPTDSNLRRYSRVMSALWRHTPALLPARFGTSARDLADLHVMVRGRERMLRRRLSAVRNRAQMTVRVVGSNSSDVGRARRGPTGKGKQSGTQYLRSRQREYDVPAFAPLRAVVRRWIRDERVEKRGGVASIYHLVPRGSVDRYESAIQEAARNAGVRMIVTGPWPPYAFADIW